MSAVLTSALFAFCCLFTLLLLRAYLPLRSTPEYILAPVFFAILIPCSVVFLVPIDLASSSGSKGIELSEKALLIGWRIGYWLCFVLTWAILPILQSFSDSGYHSTRARLIESLRANARYQAIVLTVGLAALVYFISSSGLSFTSLNALVIALAHCYALSLAIYLMGHGLVSLPRKLFQDASVSGKLRRLQITAVGVYDSLMDATGKLLEVQEEVRLLQLRKHSMAKDFIEWVDELGDITALPESNLSPRERTMLSQSVHASSTTAPPQIITEEYLAALTRRLKNAIHKRTRYLSTWGALLQDASDCQHIMNSLPTRSLSRFPRVDTSTSKPASLFPDSWTLLTPRGRFILHVYLIPLLRRIAALLLSTASIFIIWSELVSSFAPKLSLISLTIAWGGGGIFQQTITASWIAYMVISALLSLSSVRLWNGYALVPRKTSGGSACFYASYAARLTVPLSYNFLTLLSPDKTHWKDTVFNHFLGNRINLTPLGQGFNMFFPILILIPVSATLFGWYDTVKNWCGFGDYFNWGDETEDEAVEAGAAAERGGWAWREGRELIERELGAGVTASTGFLSGARSRAGVVGGAAARRVRLESGIGGGGDDDSESGFFSGFAHRLRNTIEALPDTVGIGARRDPQPTPVSGAPRPRWMRGQDQGADSDDESRSSWLRMFTGVGGAASGTRN
ncbi:LMBR1-like membrane protein-domain-containing protein [Peziza echinospora]|nr:LMBR1-like membrane protein-domain-containing protein [Peziza echinospora]